MAITLGNIGNNNAITAVTSGQVTVATSGLGEIIVLFVHNEISTDTPGSLATPVITDNQTLTWTNISTQAWIDTGDTPDTQNRQAVFWAHCPTAESVIITAAMNGTVDDATMSAICVRGAHIVTPVDDNANAIKTVNFVGSTVPTVSGFTTSGAIGIVFFGYASPINTDPGVMASTGGWVESVDILNAGGTNWSRQNIYTKTISVAESAATFSTTGATTVGGVIAFMIREADPPPLGLRFIDGFDHWMNNPTISGREFYIQQGLPHGWIKAGTTVSGLEFIPGRYTGVSGQYALKLQANSDDDVRLGTLLPGSSLSDGTLCHAGFNAYLGISSALTATGYHRFCGWASADPGGASGQSANHRVTFLILANSGATHSLHMTIGVPTVDNSGGSPNIVATGNPTRTCFGQWAYMEFGIYRSALSGTIDMWVETTGGTVENVLHYAGDTSVATIGTIDRFYLSSSRQGGVTAGQLSHAFDDFWISTSGRPGVPCYVLPFWPASDVSGAGVTGWAPATGSTNWDQIMRPQQGAFTGSTGQGPWVNYCRALAPASGADRRLVLFNQDTLPYTPNQVFAVETLFSGFKFGTTAGTSIHPPYAVIRKGSTNLTSTGGDFLSVSDATQWVAASFTTMHLNLLRETDPDTAVAWTPVTANALQFGVLVTGAAATGAIRQIHLSVMMMLVSQAVAAGGAGAGNGAWPFWVVGAGHWQWE